MIKKMEKLIFKLRFIIILSITQNYQIKSNKEQTNKDPLGVLFI